jgi:RHS repeat-associated protein
MRFEQINNTTGAVEYLHHDQQGSTRLITSSTGKTEATFTYGAYGELTGSTGTATTPLGYDGQFTNSDTGLIDLRNRLYDQSTAQFMSSDPLEAITGEPYNYADDNPVNYIDPSGLCTLDPIASGNCFSEAPRMVGGAIVSVVETAAEHPVEAGGIVLGGVALASGAGEVAGATVGAVDLGYVSVGAGAGAVGLDAKKCLGGHAVACVAVGTGIVSTGGAGFVAGGLFTGAVADGARAIGFTSGALGFLTDLADTLVPSHASAAGCR